MHYKYVNLLMLGDLKAIVNGDPNTSKLLMDNVSSNVAFVMTTYNYVGKHAIWKGPNWECLLTGLFNSKV